MNVANVGIVIVSHSPKIAEGAADMVRQMVGDSVPLAWTAAIRKAGWAPTLPRSSRRSGGVVRRRVAVLVDLGGAETNSEMAIDMLESGRRERVVVCEAPVVEGAVMAAPRHQGARHSTPTRTAEELSPT